MAPDVPRTRAERRSGPTHLKPEEEAPCLLRPEQQQGCPLAVPPCTSTGEEKRLEKGGEREDEAREGGALTGREEDGMATGAVACNPSHGGRVAGGLWWPRAPDLAEWEGAAVRGSSGCASRWRDSPDVA